jgi:hypothetical protein
MSSPNLYQSSGDTGSGDTGVNLDAHVTGNPIRSGKGAAGATVGHTWIIIVAALALLWLLGGGVFRSIRMG